MQFKRRYRRKAKQSMKKQVKKIAKVVKDMVKSERNFTVSSFTGISLVSSPTSPVLATDLITNGLAISNPTGSIQVGGGPSQRRGEFIQLQSYECRYILFPPNSPVGSTQLNQPLDVRVMLLFVKHQAGNGITSLSGASAPQVSDVFNTWNQNSSDLCSPIDATNKSNFVVLYDRLHSIQGQNSTSGAPANNGTGSNLHGHIKVMNLAKKCGKTVYNDTALSTNSLNITQGALYLLMYDNNSTAANANACTVALSSLTWFDS